MSIPVDLIIPDSGPLISLAHANRLDLLEVFDRPVAILDIVHIECLRKIDSPDHARLDDWFARHGNRLRIVETPFAAVFAKAIEDERQRQNARATRGLGDAAIAWMLRNLSDIAAKGSIPLVLTEDRDFTLDLTDATAHLLSTRAWLAGLERAGVIESAAAVIDAIGQHGRVLSNLNVDRPVDRQGIATSWEATFARSSTGLSNG